MKDGVPRAPYINPRDERIYREERELSSRFDKQELYDEREAIIEKEIIQQKKKWLKLKQERLRSLRLLGSELIGNIFERVKFLETRIKDLENSLKNRQLINNRAIDEITQDIDEKQSKINTLNDPDMIRDLQLDLTNLKMERRRETLMFWKDILELQRELHELREQLAIESKVAGLFEELREDGISN